MTTKLKVLIVEDREENINAAMEFFNTLQNVEVKYITNFETALKEIQTEIFAFGIFDIEIPKREGDKPETLGYKLAEEAEKHALDWVMITSGIDHHNCTAAFVAYCFKGFKFKEGIKTLNNHVRIVPEGFEEITEIPKNNPKAWEIIWNELIRTHENIEEIIAAKKRYKKYVGRNYTKNF